MRRAARVDANHADIKAAFLKLGCSVLDLSQLGEGCPDLLIGYGGLSICVEVKDGAKPPSARKLTAAQRDWHLDWTGGVRIVEDMEDAAKTANLLRGWHSRLS